MRIIIAGNRTITSKLILLRAILESGFTVTEVVSGGADGIDRTGEQWATESHIPIKKFPANWAEYGKKAGPLRNQQMADYADALIAIWDGRSTGTKDMIKR